MTTEPTYHGGAPRRDLSQLRIGDSEREHAAQLLSAHLTAGRLDLGEFDIRVRRAHGATRADQLEALFTDLLDDVPAQPWHQRGTELAPVGRPAQALAVLALAVASTLWVRTVHEPPFFLVPLLWMSMGRRWLLRSRCLGTRNRRPRRPRVGAAGTRAIVMSAMPGALLQPRRRTQRRGPAPERGCVDVNGRGVRLAAGCRTGRGHGRARARW